MSDRWTVVKLNQILAYSFHPGHVFLYFELERNSETCNISAYLGSHSFIKNPFRVSFAIHVCFSLFFPSVFWMLTLNWSEFLTVSRARASRLILQTGIKVIEREAIAQGRVVEECEGFSENSSSKFTKIQENNGKAKKYIRNLSPNIQRQLLETRVHNHLFYLKSAMLHNHSWTPLGFPW